MNKKKYFDNCFNFFKKIKTFFKNLFVRINYRERSYNPHKSVIDEYKPFHLMDFNEL